MLRKGEYQIFKNKKRISARLCSCTKPLCEKYRVHHSRFWVQPWSSRHAKWPGILNNRLFIQVKRVFVGSKLGLLFQINYFTRELEGVFKVHEQSICAISVSAGFCVTGSEDQFLRVWPLDFSEYFLEAKHEGVVLSLDVS